MTQFARPASDITAGNWTDEGSSFNDGNLYTSVQEVSQDGDTSYLLGDGDLTPGTFEVKLDSVGDPVSNTGHIVHIYAMAFGSGGPERIDVYLYEATTLIATVAGNWAPGRSAYADANYTLTTLEADAIGDYADLRVRVVEASIPAGESIRVTQIYMEFPDEPASTAASSQQAYIAGSVQASDNQQAYIAGGVDVSDSHQAYIAGGLLASDGQQAYIAGTDTALSNQEAYIAGGVDVVDNTEAYIVGSVNVSDNQQAYVEGVAAGTDVSDSTEAYIAGVAVASDSQQVYIEGDCPTVDLVDGEGRLITCDSVGSYARAIADTVANSNVGGLVKFTFNENDTGGAFRFVIRGSNDWADYRTPTKGYEVVVYSDGNWDTYRIEAGSRVDIGGGTWSANTNAYWLRFEAIGTDIYVKVWDASGGEPGAWDEEIDDSASGFTTAGVLQVNLSTHGSGSSHTIYLDDTSYYASYFADSQEAYIAGIATDLDSQEAYIAGAGGTSVSDSQEAYIAGAGTSASDSQEAYVAGSINISDSQQAYIAGGVNVSDSQQAYMLGDIKVDALFDNFDDNSRDTAKWDLGSTDSGNDNASVTTTETNQQLEIQPLNSTAGANYYGYKSDKLFSLENSAVFVEVVQAEEAAGANTQLVVQNDPLNGLYGLKIEVENTELAFSYNLGGADNAATVTYNSTTHRWWRIRYDTATPDIEWQTSPDGLNWTTRRTVAVSTLAGLDLTTLRVFVNAGTWQSVSSPIASIFDNLNYHPLVPRKEDWSTSPINVVEHGATEFSDWDFLLWGATSPASIIKFNSTYFLYYTGSPYYAGSPDDTPADRALGVATSLDGFNFTKYSGNPIITYTTGGSLEEGVGSGVAVNVGGTLHMYYAAIRDIGGFEVDLDIRYRSSTDGFTFTSDALVITIPGDEYTSHIIVHDGTNYHLYIRGPLAGGKGVIRRYSGTSPTSLTLQEIVLNESGGSFDGSSQTYVTANDFVVHRDQRDPARPFGRYQVRTINDGDYSTISDWLFQYTFNVYGDTGSVAVFYDSVNDLWYLYTLNLEAGSANNGDIELRYFGDPIAVGTQPVYMAGTDTDLDSQQAYIAGGIDISDSQQAYISGGRGVVGYISRLSPAGMSMATRPAFVPKGGTPASDSHQAYIAGVSTASDNQEAYIAGTDTLSDSQEAYIAGTDTLSDSQEAYIAGTDTLSDSQEAYIAGDIDVSDSQQAYIAGGINVSDSQEAYIAGGIDASDSQQAYIAGTDTLSDSQEAYIAGTDTFSDSQEAYIAGTATASDSQAAYIAGGIDVSDSQEAYIAGTATASDSQEAYIEGFDENVSSIEAYIHGVDTTLDSQEAYIAGGIDVSDSQQAYLAGIAAASDSQEAYIAGTATAVDSQQAYIAGGIDVSDSQQAYLAGIATASDSQEAYIEGFDENTSGIEAYIHGVDTTLDSQEAYIAGGINVSDNQQAYIAGTATDSDSQEAYIAGRDTASDSQEAYISGRDTASDSQEAYIAGGINVSDSQQAYMAGVAAAFSSQQAFIEGFSPGVSGIGAYIHGVDTDSDSQEAYIVGGIDVSDSQQAYIAGRDVASDNQEAYIHGVDTDSDSQEAYIHGSVDASDSQEAYIAGQSSLASSQQAYIAGDASARASQEAYIAGQNTDSDSQEAYIDGQAASTSSQEAYIAGVASDASSQQAYIAGGLVVQSSVQAYIIGLATGSNRATFKGMWRGVRKKMH